MPSDDARLTSGRLRASRACRRCNQKRVKCDALAVGQPCTRCQRGGESCVLISSRRGQYPRDRTIDSSVVARRFETHDEASPNEAAIASSTANDDGQGTISGDGQHNEQDGLQDGPGTASGSKDRQPSYQEVSWAAMFNHFLDTHQSNNPSNVVDKCSITYLGESFPLALVLENLDQEGRTRLHHPGPPLGLSDSPQHLDDRTSQPPHVLPEDVTFLSAKYAFEYPTPTVLDSLIDVFLNTYWPLYPLVNRQEFIEQYRNKQLPWILLHAICFVSATFCPLALIHQAGFTSRKKARHAFYSKAKALFDVGYESNKIVVLQSVIMLTFWGGGPNDYWNFYSWISTGVTIAEKLGLHRSTAGTNMAEKDRSLLRRLWWILVIRDASCSTLVGLPFRINMEHGDAEMLSLQDFEHDTCNSEFESHPLRDTFAAYQIEVARLSLILYQIDFARFIPGPKLVTMAQVYGSLESWRESLSFAMNWTQHPHNTNLLATSLSILYNHHIMLARLGTAGSMAIDREQSELAAQHISNAASSIVTKAQSLAVPHEVYQGVFLAGIVSYVQMRSSQNTQAQLGRMILNTCQMVMHDVFEAWDPSPWVITLFDRLTSSDPGTVQQHNENGEQHAQGLASTSVFADFDPAIFTSGIGSPWQSNPMLSALFDLPHESEAF